MQSYYSWKGFFRQLSRYAAAKAAFDEAQELAVTAAMRGPPILG